MKTFFTLLSFILLSNTLFAYQTELDLNLDLSFAEAEQENGDVNTGLSLDGSYYFKDINTTNIPLEEASFLTKSSSIGLKYGYKADYHGLSRRFEETEVGQFVAIKGKFVVDDFLLSASYAHAILTDNGDIDNITQKRLLVGLGKYLTDTSTLLISYLRYEDIRTFKATRFGYTDREDNGIDIAYKSFNTFSNSQSLSYGGNFALLNTKIIGITTSDYTYEYGAHISYYPNQYWMLGLRAAIKDFQVNRFVDKRQMYKLTTRYYFLQSLALDLSFGQIYGEDEIGSVEGALVNLGLRFRF